MLLGPNKKIQALSYFWVDVKKKNKCSDCWAFKGPNQCFANYIYFTLLLANKHVLEEECVFPTF